MELKEAISKRRSIRKFEKKEISHQKIEEIIFSASLAPSACNRQLWRFIVIDNLEIKQRIVDEGGSVFIKDAPVGIVVLYDNQTDNLEYQDHIQSAAAAIQNMLLTATSLGIGSCWVCHLPLKSTMKKILRISRCFDPVAYILLGYPRHETKPRPTINQSSEIISWNKFSFKDVKQPKTKLYLRRITRNAYFNLPIFLKKSLRFLAERFVKKFD